MTTDAAILTALRNAQNMGISGAALSQQLGVSRAAIWAHIEDLRRFGYEIEASPHSGYRLIKSTSALHPDDLTSRLGGNPVIGRDIRVFRETTSTNDIAEKLAHDQVPEGVVVFAERQTKGRGRLSRRWESQAGLGLWFSILLRPALPPQAATRITITSAVSIARALRQSTGLDTRIKWPNDIQIGGRKVAGILTEMTAETDRIRSLIIGIGLNVNQRPGDFSTELRDIATSLRIESGKDWDRPELAAELLRHMDADYKRLSSGAFDSIASEWESLCGTLGRNVRVQMGDRMLQGTAEALDSEGALLLRTSHGSLERILGGDVTVMKS